MRTARDGTLDRYPSICGAGVDRIALRDRGSRGIPGALFGGQESAVAEHAVPERDVARRSGRDDRGGQGGVSAHEIADREARDGQLPEREVSPRAVVPFELDRSSGVHQRVVCPPAGHAGAEHRTPGLEGSGPVWRPALERPAFGDIREAHRRRHIARGDLLPGRQHGQPRARLQDVRTQTPGPCSDRRTVAGPVIVDEAVADQRGDEVGVVRREGVVDGALDGVARLIPRGSSPVQGRHPIRLADRELTLEEVAEERVVAVRPPVVVHKQGRSCKLPQDIGRPLTICHDIAQRRGQLAEDRGAGHERDLGRGSALEHLGSQVVVDEMFSTGIAPARSSPRRPGSEHRERQQSRPPLRLPCQARCSLGRQPQPEFASKSDGLTLVHRQLRGTDLEQ